MIGLSSGERGTVSLGYGDEIMVTGEARRLQRTDPRPVRVLGRGGYPRWSPIWALNPRFAPVSGPESGADAQEIVNGPGARPYIDYVAGTRERLAFTDWRATRGELPSIRHLRRPGEAVVIEPAAEPFKQWGHDRWQALVDRLPAVSWVQLGPDGTRPLSGVRWIRTPAFIDACVVLAGARAAVLPEGGLHHAAAALALPAVVLFGGYIAPRTTGYDGHVNLAVDDPEALGWRRVNPAGLAAFAQITVDRVADSLAAILSGPSGPIPPHLQSLVTEPSQN